MTRTPTNPVSEIGQIEISIEDILGDLAYPAGADS